jgi:hypothetical protein
VNEGTQISRDSSRSCGRGSGSIWSILQDESDGGIDQSLNAKEEEWVLVLELGIHWRASTDEMDFHCGDKSLDKIDDLLTSVLSIVMSRAIVDDDRESEEDMSTEDD